MIGKPQTFDLNDRRSDKTGSSRDWTPADALYSASQALDEHAKALLVVWWDGSDTQFRLSGDSAAGALMAVKFLQTGV